MNLSINIKLTDYEIIRKINFQFVSTGSSISSATCLYHQSERTHTVKWAVIAAPYPARLATAQPCVSYWGDTEWDSAVEDGSQHLSKTLQQHNTKERQRQQQPHYFRQLRQCFSGCAESSKTFPGEAEEEREEEEETDSVPDPVSAEAPEDQQELQDPAADEGEKLQLQVRPDAPRERSGETPGEKLCFWHQDWGQKLQDWLQVKKVLQTGVSD